jgi:hypothetical protein
VSSALQAELVHRLTDRDRMTFNHMTSTQKNTPTVKARQGKINHMRRIVG